MFHRWEIVFRREVRRGGGWGVKMSVELNELKLPFNNE